MAKDKGYISGQSQPKRTQYWWLLTNQMLGNWPLKFKVSDLQQPGDGSKHWETRYIPSVKSVHPEINEKSVSNHVIGQLTSSLDFYWSKLVQHWFNMLSRKIVYLKKIWQSCIIFNKIIYNLYILKRNN